LIDSHSPLFLVAFSGPSGNLKEEVYVHQLTEFVIIDQEGKALRLKREMYGLQQAPRGWDSKLDDTLKNMNFVQREHEHAMYRHSCSNSILVEGVYVDNLVITGSSLQGVEELRRR
jgi:hypothetical protein